MPSPRRSHPGQVLMLVCVTLALGAAVLPAIAAAAPAANPAQEAPVLRPAWSVRLDGAVEWQRVAPLGQVLVKTGLGLTALDPASGRVLWTLPGLGAMAQDHYEEIAGTSLVVLSDGLQKPRVVILDSVDGRVLFDSRAAGVNQVLSRHYLPKSRALLLFGFSEGDPATSMFLVDVERGSLRWKNNHLLAGQGNFTRKLTAFLQAATNQSGIVGEPVELDPDTFVIASSTEIFAVKTQSGEIAWRAPNAHSTRATRFHVSPRAPGMVFVGSETTFSSMTTTTGSQQETVQSEYTARRIADGAAAWEKPVKVHGGLNDVIFADQGLILSPATTGKGKILLCDYKTGESMWGRKGKGIDIQGGILNHDWTTAGLVLTTGYDSAWTNKGTEYFLTLLDPDSGALRFEEPLKLRGRIETTQVIPAGLLYTTTSEVNILDLKTGKTVLAEGLRSDDSLVTTVHGRSLYAYAGKTGTLHRLDLDRATLSTVSREPARLEEDEAPTEIEMRGDRVTVLSSQNVVSWGADGALLFHAYYASPRLPGLMRALLRAEQVRMAMASAAAGMGSVAFAGASTKTAPGSIDRAVTATAATGYAQAAEQAASLSARYGEQARTRFKATTTVPDFVFMMVARGRGTGLARVDKETGRIETVIDLGHDREPVYDVDAVSNLIFYRPAPDTVSGYRF
ncbi:MAG TPA: PQQ-binding-like beta-propeller repeat protein [Candidatus Polarisedimenticolia bacterium]|nr:PQQ-binding-like beta-propeller repeat protein [Candidatus Polarisedimenticolia bacterium]